jgi:hypothetical protein
MIEHEVYIAYAPRGPGVMCALMYVEIKRSVYGWYVGARGAEFPSQFFILEDYYSDSKIRLYLSTENDIYGLWVQRQAALDAPVGRPAPIAEDLTHELVREQDAFVREWLFFAGEPSAKRDESAYASHDLAVQPCNIRADRLNKLNAIDLIWWYASTNCNLNMVRTLSRRWSLDYVLN